MSIEDFLAYRRKVLKLNGHRVHKVTNSLGVYDAYKWIRKNKWFDIGRPVQSKEFYSIIREINNALARAFIEGEPIVLPYSMGKLELRIAYRSVAMKNGKMVINYPVDWSSTLKLWCEDAEAQKNKTLVRFTSKQSIKPFYNKHYAQYTNRIYFDFSFIRHIKREICQRVKEGIINESFVQDKREWVGKV